MFKVCKLYNFELERGFCLKEMKTLPIRAVEFRFFGSGLMDIYRERVFIVSDLIAHRASVFVVSTEGPPNLSPFKFK